jgi:hypothetical protein
VFVDGHGVPRVDYLVIKGSVVKLVPAVDVE